MKMSMKKPGAEIAKTIDEKVNERVTAELLKVDEKVSAEMSKVRAEIEKKAKEDIEKTLKEEKEKKALEEGKRVGTILDDLKAKSAKVIGDKSDIKAHEKAEKAADKGIDCPTCHSHAHVLGNDGLTVKCTGPDCGKELVMVSKSANYKCVGCGIPLEITEKHNIDTCPFCSGKKALKFDWSKIAKLTQTGAIQGPSQAAK